MSNLLQHRKEIENLIRQHAPILYLAPQEQYQLANVEFFFKHANLNLVGGANNPIKTHPLKIEDLPVGKENKGKYQLVLMNDSPEVRGGDLSQAKVYVHAKTPDTSHLDLQFWFFYAYNGPGTIYMEAEVKKPRFGWPPYKTESGSGTAGAEPLGEHEGDWEHITMRFDTGSYELTKVYFSQHSGGVWKKRSELKNWEDGRLVVFSSRNGHASYPDANVLNLTEKHGWNVELASFTFGLVNATDKGTRFDVAENFELVAVDHTLADGPFPEPHWLNFYGRWGASQDGHLSDKAIEKIGHMILGDIATTVLAIPGVGSAIKVTIQHFATMEEDGPTAPKMKSSWDGSEG